jgi:hypothetical protein
MTGEKKQRVQRGIRSILCTIGALVVLYHALYAVVSLLGIKVNVYRVSGTIISVKGELDRLEYGIGIAGSSEQKGHVSTWNKGTDHFRGPSPIIGRGYKVTRIVITINGTQHRWDFGQRPWTVEGLVSYIRYAMFNLVAGAILLGLLGFLTASFLREQAQTLWNALSKETQAGFIRDLGARGLTNWAARLGWVVNGVEVAMERPSDDLPATVTADKATVWEVQST